MFPGRVRDKKVGPVAEPRAKDARDLPSPHRLRDTFASAGHEARVHPLDLKVLLNHRLPTGDVTEGYIRPSVDHLRDAIERIAAFLLEKKAGVRKRAAG